MSKNFDKYTFKKRLNSMLGVDFRRMFTSRLFYIMIGISFVMPILILVMTTMMDGTISVDKNGVETVIEGFENVWQIIGSTGSMDGAMSMDITSMCNINMMFFVIAIFVCIFIADEFRSGYVKNLFTVRASKIDYVLSKSIVLFLSSGLMIITFFIGAIMGGAISNLSFAMEGINIYNIICCLMSKVFLVGLFTSIYILASVFAKQQLWLSILLSLGIGMLFFMTVPLITPIDSTIVNVLLCLIGSGIFGFAIGIASYYVLKKTNLI